MEDKQKVEVITPDPKRLIDSLRSVGHSFHTAVADVVDNSIEAEATEIHIDVSFVGLDSSVRISDNGKGMTREDLVEAMRFGTKKEYPAASGLGKFGLGLKTASFSQCRSFVVGSRSRYAQDISVLAWDMDHVEKSACWEVVDLTERENASDVQLCHSFLGEASGTVIIWKQLNMMQEYKDPNGQWAKSGLHGVCRELETHLGMVFHRFLGGEQGEPILIFLNENKIEPWDPFVREESHTQKLEPIDLKVDQKESRVRLEPFVLPKKEKFSSPDKFEAAGGPRKWNRHQGFYIYRSGRMIQSGGWCNLRTIDEHHKLARIALHFSPVLDEEFDTDISKMKVSLPDTIREDVKKAIRPLIKMADDTYRHHESSTPPRTQSKSNIPGKSIIASGFPDRPKKWSLNEIEDMLMKVADGSEKLIIKEVIQKLRESIKVK